MTTHLTRLLARAHLDPTDRAALSALASELRRLGIMGQTVGDLLFEDIRCAYGLSCIAASGESYPRRWEVTSKEGESRTAYPQPDEDGWTHNGMGGSGYKLLSMLAALDRAASEAALAGKLLSVLRSVAEAGQPLSVRRGVEGGRTGEQSYRLPNGWSARVQFAQGNWVYIDHITSPNGGRSWSFDDLPDAVRHWRPEAEDVRLWPAP